jgi:hypothetical protein
MNFNFRNILLGDGKLRRPESVSGGRLYKFDGPTQGLYFQSNLGEYRRLYVFDGTEAGLHFLSTEEQKDPSGASVSHLYKFDVQNEADEVGRVWSLYFQSGDGANQSWPFTSELSVQNITGSSLPAGWTVASSCKFYASGYLEDGYWLVQIYPAPPSGFVDPFDMSCDLSAYPGAILSKTQELPLNDFENHPLGYSATGKFRMSVGTEQTGLILAESHPDVLRQAIDALPSVQAGSYVVTRWACPEASRMLAYNAGGPYWFFRTGQLRWSGIVSTATTFRLSYAGDTTGDLAITSTSAQIAAALNSLPSISALGSAVVSELSLGASAESGYNPEICGNNNALRFKVSFTT